MQNIFVAVGTEQRGPFTDVDIRAQLAAGYINGTTLVWWDGLPAWTPLGQTLLGAPVPPPVPMSAPPPVPSSMPPPAPPLPVPGARVPGALHPGPAPRVARPSEGLPAWAIVLIVACVGLPFISVIAISVLIALGNQVKGVFTTISSQLIIAQPPNQPNQ